MIKILNLNLVILLISKYQNIFAKDYTPNWSVDVFVIKKVENTVPWTYVINHLILTEKKSLEHSTKKNVKTNQKEFRNEKVIGRKGGKLYVKWKGYNHSLHSWIDKKKTQYKLVSIFQNDDLQKQCKVELDLSNYATKTDLKNATGVDTLEFAKKLI